MKTFNTEVSNTGITFSLSEKKKSLFRDRELKFQVNAWSATGDAEILLGLAALGNAIQDLDSTYTDKVRLDHNAVAELDDAQAKALGLPPSVPYQLRIWSEGSWLNNSYTLNSEFLDGGHPVYVDRREGSIITIGRINYRLPNPIFALIEEVSAFPSSRDEKLESQSRISSWLNSSSLSESSLIAEEQVANIRIRHIAGFSSSISGSMEDPTLLPVLFSKRAVESVSLSGDLLDETHQVLTSEQSVIFSQQFKQSPNAQATYVLNTGEYIYIDPSVRPALSAFRKICSSDSDTRKAFIKAPTATLAELLDHDEISPEALINQAFLQTTQFSERVIGINEWKVPDLPWLAQERNDWGTETLVFEATGSTVSLIIPKSRLSSAIDSIKTAARQGLTNTIIEGQDIVVSDLLIQEMERLLPAEPDDLSPAANELPDESEDKPKSSTYVVETIDSYESINYAASLTPPDVQIDFEVPRALVPKTKLMAHQRLGFRWLVDCYNKGLKGVLNADDMGLGKTLQSLVFLALYQQKHVGARRKPLLIVAPTGLLSNWQEEIKIHLGDFGLGNIVEAYGGKLKGLKDGVSGKDTDFGVPMLKLSILEHADVVLTTYESLRDYQVSFAGVNFGVGVFDEIQKAKNPKSLISRTIAAMNTDFSIGLSGTPVENSLADLWTILDLLVPGLIKLSLLDFMRHYSGSTEDPMVLENLRSLQRDLVLPKNGNPPPVLRRMKHEVFANGDLPEKRVNLATSTSYEMPPLQADTYKEQLSKVQSGEHKMIQALQGLKRISLAPSEFEKWSSDINGFIAESARLIAFFNVLDQIKARDEKVLVFLESLKLQPVLAQILKERYSLERLPLIINGSISGMSRQKAVHEFQNKPTGFDVMLISPKAGGVGLNLVAANNVVHLERWWNPAVEDQCNDRAYRIGQDRDVNIYTPIAIHPVKQIPSFDLVLNEILERKRALANSLFIPSEITPEEFGLIFTEDSAARSLGFKSMSLEETQLLGSGEEFEQYVAFSLRDAGFTVSITKQSWDYGCDLIAERDGHVILCQVKQVRSDKTLQQGVDEILTAKKRYQSRTPTHLALITNAMKLARRQSRLAEDNEVICVTGKDVDHYGEALIRFL